jgi:HEAT repeat protein
MARLSFKTDASFFRKIAIGAVGARAVCEDLKRHNHLMVELENGSTDTKIWKDVKRKRVRIPDLVCIHCGVRVESRAKTSPSLSMSHSSMDAERAWDFGMVDNDILAFPVCKPAIEFDWSTGQLKDHRSYWHNRERVQWEIQGAINYFRVEDFRTVAHARSSTKGVTEGAETSISWDAVFSTRKGLVEAVKEGQKISIRRESDGHLYTWQNPRAFPVAVEEGSTVEKNQVIASSVQPLDVQALRCLRSLPSDHIPSLLASPERTQRFTGVKLARLRDEPQFADLVQRVAFHPDEDVYVQLEGAIYLTRVCGVSAQDLFGPYLENPDDQIKLETVVALAESATTEAVEILAGILDPSDTPYFLRSAAAWALGRIGTDKAIDRLVRAFSDVDQSIREEALATVASLGDPALEHLMAGLLGDDADVAAGSAEAIRRQALVPPDAVQRIIEEIKADAQRIWAVWLLGQLGGREYISAAIAELQDSRPEAHYAINVLWAFVESWVSRHWELYPTAGALFDST